MRALATVFKIAATVAIFWFVLSRVDLRQLITRLSAGQIAAALAAAVAVLSVQALALALRLRACARLLEHRLRGFNAWAACQLGGLFNHTPASFVGGDALRIWNLSKGGIPLQDAAKSVLVDRALGFLAMMLLVLAVTPMLQLAITDPRMLTGYYVLLGVGLVAGGTFIVLGRMRVRRADGWLGKLAEFATVSRYLWARPKRTVQALFLALVINILNSVAIWLIGFIYGTAIDFRVAMVASPVVFLIAMIPISVAGWGLREGAFVVSFGLFGVASADALAVSITFGIAVLLAYLPAVGLLVLGKQIAKTASEAQFDPASSRPTGRS